MLLLSHSLTSRRLFLAIPLCLLLSACSTIPDGGEPESGGPSSAQSVDADRLAELLNRAERQDYPAAGRSLLEAAELLVEMGREGEALATLNTLALEHLPAPLAGEAQLLKARLLLEEGKAEEALASLRDLPVPLPRLPREQQKAIRFLRSDAHMAAGDFLSAARQRIQAGRLLNPGEIRDNHEKIWNALILLSPDNLTELAREALGFEDQGWYELAVIGTAYQYNLDRQLVALEEWQVKWSRHPAASTLPRALEVIQTIARERPDHIALMLPLKTQAGEVIRDGFMSAYFNVQKIGGKVPSVTFYDTSRTTDIMPLYEKALADGAQMIIGPLQKPLVSQLHQAADLAVPVLALNHIGDGRPRSREFYQFSLSPEHEARQVARRAWRDGHRLAAVLSPPDSPGDDYYQRKRESFIQEWEKQGGQVVAREVFRDNFTEVVSRLLNLEASGHRRDSVSELLGQPLAFTQRRRKDIDFIYLIAQPSAARQINPSLAYLYAGDIPVYATQDVYSGQPRPLDDRDLNGVMFGDSPWLLASGDELRQSVQSLFPHNSALHLRLQAFGVDAFRLYPRLKQLREARDIPIFGATGILRMDESGVIRHDLMWARFDEGLAEPLPDQPFPSLEKTTD